MAKALTVVEPRDFSELLDVVERFQQKTEASWYRGCRSASYALAPSLFRHRVAKNIDEIAALELNLTTRFVQRSLPFLSRALVNDWDKLFLMQHYGVPTRLLDWSENPFVGIYFALSDADGKSDAALWMCDPISWNRAALDHFSFRGGILDESSEQLRPYAPKIPVKDMPNPPIMIYGTYNSARIVAQRGGFALFGQGLDPMEKVSAADKFPDGVLTKVVLKATTILEMRTSLFRKGFTESVVFPDLDGLARELRRVTGF